MFLRPGTPSTLRPLPLSAHAGHPRPMYGGYRTTKDFGFAMADDIAVGRKGRRRWIPRRHKTRTSFLRFRKIGWELFFDYSKKTEVLRILQFMKLKFYSYPNTSNY